jgi:hypothetical protein
VSAAGGWRAAVDRNRYVRALWSAKLDRAITPTTYLIGRALLRRASKAGQCWPSLETIAADVGCSVRTATRAVRSLRLLSLLSWMQRKARWNRRASNLYALAVPNREGRNRFESSEAIVSTGLVPAGVAAALSRLGAALGVSAGEVMPWIAAV